MLVHLLLQDTSAQRSKAEYFQIHLSQDLFDEYVVTRKWGYTGRQCGQRRHQFKDKSSATSFFKRIVRDKIKSGYTIKRRLNLLRKNQIERTKISNLKKMLPREKKQCTVYYFDNQFFFTDFFKGTVSRANLTSEFSNTEKTDNVIRLVPKRRSAFLNKNTFSFFARVNGLDNAALKMHRAKMHYIGNIISMSPLELQKTLDLSSEELRLIIAKLEKIELRLGSVYPRWKSPSPQR